MRTTAESEPCAQSVHGHCESLTRVAPYLQASFLHDLPHCTSCYAFTCTHTRRVPIVNNCLVAAGTADSWPVHIRHNCRRLDSFSMCAACCTLRNCARCCSLYAALAFATGCTALCLAAYAASNTVAFNTGCQRGLQAHPPSSKLPPGKHHCPLAGSLARRIIRICSTSAASTAAWPACSLHRRDQHSGIKFQAARVCGLLWTRSCCKSSYHFGIGV